MEWFDEKVENIKGDKFIYKTICFLLGGPKKRLSYKQLYLFLYGLNKRKLGEDDAKKFAISRIVDIYASHHDNNYPKELNL